MKKEIDIIDVEIECDMKSENEHLIFYNAKLESEIEELQDKLDRRMSERFMCRPVFWFMVGMIFISYFKMVIERGYVF